MTEAEKTRVAVMVCGPVTATRLTWSVYTMIRLRERVNFAETDYGTALFDELSGLYWLVSTTGTLALRVLLDGGDIDEAITAVLDRYLVDRDTMTRHLHNLLARLHDAGLVTA